ncbi:cytochrome P450 2J6-like [Elgaria multicarinata webbii]|uniref:cytochrome P450 2J6-like n=1 Tax=Elgaria multicarinata webbii TaxID=159646 RepID=UPI002FCCCCF7
MMGIWAFLIALLVALLILVFLRQLWTRRHYPPGPLSLPVIGGIWRIGIRISEDLAIKIAKQYGNICCVWLGHQPVIAMSGFQAVKEVLINHAEAFSERPSSPLVKAVGREKGLILSKGHTWKQQRRFSVVTLRKLGLGKKGMEHQIQEEAQQLVETFARAKGIAFSNGHTWKQQRKFGVVTLRKLGLGKKGMEHQIQDEAQQLVEIFARAKGQPLDPSLHITNAVSNVICAVTFGHRFSLEDEKFQKMIEDLNVGLKFPGSIFHILYEIFPWIMNHLPGPHKKVFSSMEEVLSYSREEIEKHKEQQSFHEPQDFIDFYLLQIEKSRNDPNSTYDEENLAQCIIEFIIAGTETTTTTMKWALLFLTNHPDIQDKVYKEIEDVFGSSHSICYQDIKKLPYTNAVIHEMQRSNYILLFGVPRQCAKDVNVNGYLIPKGAYILPDLRSVLLDPERWETPEEFNPNHFLDKDGNFVAREEFLPFGAGARVCPGEQLAMIEIFIFLTSLLRMFTFQLPEGLKKLNPDAIKGITFSPHPYKICAVPRCSSS